MGSEWAVLSEEDKKPYRDLEAQARATQCSVSGFCYLLCMLCVGKTVQKFRKIQVVHMHCASGTCPCVMFMSHWSINCMHYNVFIIVIDVLAQRRARRNTTKSWRSTSGSGRPSSQNLRTERAPRRLKPRKNLQRQTASKCNYDAVLFLSGSWFR